MKLTIGYGLKFDDESLKRVAKVYLGGGTAFETKAEALARIETLKKIKEIPKKEKVKLVKFTIEDTE
jgi:coproporphyrinogen III oxidase-like Fe-S oxidoreductase